MTDYEKLGVFYLGKPYDLASKAVADEPYLYDSKDLTTHAICVGMTGSGKTGLCIAMLEEAAIDGIPVLAIDVKGDLANLALTFPQLRGEDFAPWVDASEAARRSISVDELGKEAAGKWQKGLADWQQDAARVGRLRDAAPVTIYTPGANIGVPLAVLRALTAPPPAIRENAESLQERSSGAVSSLLTLLGVESDPMTGREHVFLTTVVQNAWYAGQDLTLAALIALIQSPGFTQIGVMNLETFYPAKDRFALAMRINTLIASPAFAAWTQGEPLNIAKLLWTDAGKPRISVVSIAHLDDAQRMFFVSSLMTEVLTWMRQQNGSSSLRAILYMDEIFGYFPPSAAPPSKLPMLTLLKQARAFGLGIMLATQNPVDLDYKGLANCGTWLIGRLQTDRDKQRLLDGLEGAAAVGGKALDRAALEKMMSALDSRVFLVNNVHENYPVLIKSRFALSYLPGPLSREQITKLKGTSPVATAISVPANASMGPTSAAVSPTRALGDAINKSVGALGAALSWLTSDSSAHGSASPVGDLAIKPAVPPTIKEGFLAARIPSGFGYQPMLLAVTQLHFVDAKAGIDLWEKTAYLLESGIDAAAPDWSLATVLTKLPTVHAAPVAGAVFSEVNALASQPSSYASLAASAKTFVYANRKLSLWRCAELKQTSKPAETEGEFRVRLGDLARVARDEAVEKLRKKYAPKVAALETKLDKAGAKVEKEQSQASSQTMDTALSVGAGILGAILGRKTASAANISRARTAAKSASRASKERGDVSRAKDEVAQLEQDVAALEAELAQEVADITAKTSIDNLQLEQVDLTPRKGDIVVEPIVLAWTPRTTAGLAV